MTRRFDAIIIGAGQAGPSLADRLTRAGMKVALIERKLFGGTCVNTGCTPTKTLVASAYAAHLARRSREYGVVFDGPVKVDMARVKARADTVSANSRTGVEKWLRGMPGCTVIQGHARFEGPDAIRVGEERLSAPRIFINVGGRAAVPDMPGLGEVPYLTNGSILMLDRVPEHLVVVGGSYIGLEFAQMYRRFGATVTIVEKGPRLIAREDEDVSEAIRAILVEEGITVRTRAECIAFSPRPDGVAVSVDCRSGEPEIVASHVLLAVGRRPNTDDLDLDRAGITTDARGYITVDEGLATSVPGIWALGDCNGRGAFTHTAYNDFEIVAANLLGGEERRVSDRIPAYALYIDPPLGRVGMTVAKARETGRPLLIGKRPMSRVSRAIEKGETNGFMQVVVDAETHKILGAAILGTGGDEAIHGVLDMMNAGVSYATLKNAVPIHPTVSELIPTMLSEMRPAEVREQTGSRPQDGREQQVILSIPRREIMNPSTERAVLAGGCFWGMQHLLRRYPGVVSTRVGYTGGDVRNATYRNHGTHAEALEIIFDPASISYRKVLEFFFQIHDPTTRNRQGNDIGASYRSAIFYTSDEQKRIAEDTIADVDASELWPGKVVTEVAPAGNFWEAEPEHQDYLERIPNGYNCHFVRPDWTLPVRNHTTPREASVTA